MGKGNIGVLIARAGVGKTACLIHIAFDKLFRNENLIHVSLEDGPEKVISYYNVIFYDLMKALDVENDYEMRMLLEKNRMILAYLNQSFEMGRLRTNVKNLVEKVEFMPDALIVDGIDFEKAGREMFEDFKEFAEKFQVEIWFSARAHRHITVVNKRGIPYPCNHLDDFFSIILQLQPLEAGLLLKLLKDHDHPILSGLSIRLDPSTFLLQHPAVYSP